MNEAGFLLTAKLNRPRVTRDLVVRSRLLELLDAGLSSPLTLVVATAGFGKTTLVSSWVEQLQSGLRPGTGVIPSAWLSFDDGDGDPMEFLRYFISALRGIFPGAAPQTWQQLTARQSPPLSFLAALLSNEIESLPADFVFVLDDAHTIQGQEIFEILNTWMRHWPRPLHLVLISRRSPPLALTNWRARGKVVEVRPRDMRFTEPETAEFLTRTLGDNIAPEAIAALHGQLEGWIAGLRLAMLSMDSGEDLAVLPAHVIAGDVYITDYLLEEILLRQPPNIQRFLLTISVTRQFCESLCVALFDDEAGVDTVQESLEYLDTHELLQIHLDGRDGWLRFHHLFRDLLLQRLQRDCGAEEVRRLHTAAARWYAQHGLPDEALSHAREVNDFALMTEIMWGGLRDALNREDRPTIERWLAMLPAAVIDRSMELLLMSALDHGLRWELVQMQRRIDQVVALLNSGHYVATDSEHDRVVRGHIASMVGQAAFDRHQPAITAASCREAHDLLPDDWHYSRGVAAAYVALGLQSTGRDADAQAFLSANYEATADKNGSYALRLLLGLALNALHTGQLESARQTAEAMLQQAQASELTVMQGWGHYLIGYVRYEFSEFAGAEAHFRAAVDMRFSTQLLAARGAISGLAHVYAAQGDLSRAQACADDLSRLDFQLYGRAEPSTAALHALLAVRQGKADEAAEWTASITLPPDEQPLLLWTEAPLMGRIATLVARNNPGDIEAVLEALDLLDNMAAREFNRRTPVTLLAWRAMAKLAQGELGAARQALIRSVELARRTGHRQLYVDMGEPMRRLLGQIATERTVSTTVRSILSSFPASEKANLREVPDEAIDIDRLTRREMEILALMAEPVSLSDIAAELNISPATAKRHSINLYDKLGVHTRWDAVARGVELGLLHSS